MARQPSNKALAVLALLREQGELTCKEVAHEIRQRTPCGGCHGTGAGDSRFGCAACYGRGLVPFHYGDAYVCLAQLRKLGLVRRRHVLDEWGDTTSRLVWCAAERERATDPLEALYEAASAEVDS